MPNVSIPIAITHRTEIIERLAAGELVREIAASLGCSRQALSVQLASDAEYQAASLEAIEARMEMYENELATAQDGLTVARADKLLSHTRYVASVRNPSRWAPVKQAVQVNTDGPATINVISYSDTPADT